VYGRAIIRRRPILIWLKRSFHAADFAPYQEKLAELMMAMPNRYSEFLMVSTENGPLDGDYYVGLPDGTPFVFFDEFEQVREADLPKQIDTFLVGDQTKEPFTSRFKFKKRY
jgi:hypothetical protein